MRILLIDDDEPLMEVLANKLIAQHYAVDIATDGEMGWEFILLFNYDLVLLDWMLPDTDGLALCQQIRRRGCEMPIMLLTARDNHSDKVKGLDAGADDYVVKPFDFEELTARIRALLRREIHVASPILQYADLSFNPKTHEVKYQQQLLPLTPKEYVLIELFLRHPQQVFSPRAIIDNLWAGEDPPGEEAVRTHIKGLRQKLKAAGLAKDTIQTVYGVGYRLKSAIDKEIEKVSQANKSQKSDYSAKIQQAWSTFKNVTEERLEILNNLTSALSENRANQEHEQQQQAQSSAHKLAGSLGSFGFPEGSKIAKKIENLLENKLINQTNVNQFRQLVDALSTEIHHQPFEDSVNLTFGKNVSLLIVERDGETFTQQLATEAHQWQMKTHTAFTIERAREIIDIETPTAVLLKIVFPDDQGLVFLEQLHHKMSSLPIVVIIENAQLSDRLEVVRRGGNLVLQHPVLPKEAISSVAELVKDLGSSAKVMIVDDDSQILASLEISLQPWGFQLTTLDDPQQFWDVLEKTNPDLLVLDIEMPGINGIELCQMLRCDRRWQHLPVLFLTVHDDPKTQHQAFAIGADDYICKPVVGLELVNRILNRLERSKR
jgi:DNA-binding response OmpR family regulator/HPt (histidine-containing phosphotransfer) domain-containing protein